MYKVLSNTSENQSLLQDIQFLYEILDRKIPSIQEEINSKIYDYASAIQATKYYDKSWFCNLIASVDAKVQIATLLKMICSNFNVSSLIWDGIENRTVSILEQIDILQNKDNFRKSFEG